MKSKPNTPKTERFVLRLDRDLIDRLDRVAREEFEGNRSYTVRKALRELIERYESTSKEAA